MGFECLGKRDDQGNCSSSKAPQATQTPQENLGNDSYFDDFVSQFYLVTTFVASAIVCGYAIGQLCKCGLDKIRVPSKNFKNGGYKGVSRGSTDSNAHMV
jgi:hypothetical protein